LDAFSNKQKIRDHHAADDIGHCRLQFVEQWRIRQKIDLYEIGRLR